MRPVNDPRELFERAANGERRALSRLVSLVENGGDPAREALSLVWPHTGGARILGITGPPGSGKSTLTNALVKHLRLRGHTVGVIAVDPSSPFTGGAILGDRIRMSSHALDSGVYIRSMGTRGQLGGLSAACTGAARVLDACGFAYIILETVGVGQSEVAVARCADVVTVVSVPGLGDDVQASKAGILEIGDIFVVNKCDLPGADRVVLELKSMLDMDQTGEKKNAPVLKTSASSFMGIEAYGEALDAMWQQFAESGELAKRRQQRLQSELLEIMQSEIIRRAALPKPGTQAMEAFMQEKKNPYEWVDATLSQILK